MTSSCAKRCAATLSSTTSSAYIRLYATFLRSPLSGSVACNHVSTKAVQDPPPVRAFYLASVGGGGAVNLGLVGRSSSRRGVIVQLIRRHEVKGLSISGVGSH